MFVQASSQIVVFEPKANQEMSATPLAAAVDPWQPPYHRHTSFRAWEQSSISDLRDPKFGCLHLTLFMVVRVTA